MVAAMYPNTSPKRSKKKSSVFAILVIRKHEPAENMSSEDTQPHRSASRGYLPRTHSLHRLAVALSCPPKQLWDSLWPHLPFPKDSETYRKSTKNTISGQVTYITPVCL